MIFPVEPMAQSRHALAKDVVLADQYRIDTVLGAGGFGITYMATDLGLGSVVVLKEYFPAQIAVRDQSATVFPHSDREEPIFQWGRDRFVREARILDSCRHPHIVRVRRVFETNNTAYMALDFEDGPNLEAWLKTLGRPPTQGEVDAIVWPILDALAYLHALPQPVIHRDIAPDNIIMRGGKHPVLIDFGAAKVETVGRAESRVGAVKDGYSPREQYSQKPELQGPWTDIYAMAATIRRAITGERPPDSMGRDLDDTMPAMTVLDLAGFRRGFLEGIDAAMRVQHTERPQSVDAWRNMLFDGVDDGAGQKPRTVSHSVPRSQPRSQPRLRPQTALRPVPPASPSEPDRHSGVPADSTAALFSAPPAKSTLQAPSGQRSWIIGLGVLALLGSGMAMAQYLRRPPAQVAVVTQPEVPDRGRGPTPAETQETGPPPASTPSATPSPPAATSPVSASAAFQLAEECRRLAQPPARGFAGVLFEDLDGAASTRACDAAVRAVPDNTRLETLLGRSLAKTANFGAARQWFERAATKGDAYAMFHLGVLYADAQGVRRDYIKAREWYEKAIAKDEPHAMNTLGILIENGRGVPADPAKAREWYEKAIAAGNVPALFHLGNLYTNGRGVAQDYVRAVGLFEQAAARNHSGALSSLGFAHENGRGVIQDHVKARDFYERAADRGNAVAMNNLGLLYENGRGVAQDLTKAREWYEKAADRGNSRGMLHLGVIYANGRGVTQDYATARGWYEKAIERGEALAMFNLAFFYDQGRAVDKDANRAAALLLQAARAGSTNAAAALAGTMARWTPDTVRAVQTSLLTSGQYKGQVTGTWDAASQAAAKLYAEARS